MRAITEPLCFAGRCILAAAMLVVAPGYATAGSSVPLGPGMSFVSASVRSSPTGNFQFPAGATADPAARNASIDAFPIDDTLGEWRYVGPADWPGKVLDIAVSHQSPGVVYAAYGLGGVWKTTNAGERWLRITPLQFNTLAFGAVEVWAGGDQTVAIASGHGDYSASSELKGKVWLSRDGGETLVDITPPGLGDHAVVRIAFDAADYRRMYVLTPANIFRTDDGGQSWANRHTFRFKADHWDDLPDLAVDPNNFARAVFVHPLDGTRFTTSGGVSWTAAEPAAALSGPGVVAWSKSEPGTAYIQLKPYGSQITSIYRSSDAGARFELVRQSNEANRGRYAMSIAIHPTNPHFIVAANTSYQYSSNRLQSLTSIDCCHRVNFSDVVFAPGNPSIVYAGSDQGIFRMTDGGVSIQNASRFDAGVHTQHTFALAISRQGNARMAFANGGDHPTLRADITGPIPPYTPGPQRDYTSVGASPMNPDLILSAGGNDPLRRSTDRGLSWNVVEFLDRLARENKAPIEFSQQDPARVFVASTHVYRSLQSGAAGSWTSIGPPVPMGTNRNLRVLRVAPSTHDTLYAGGALSAPDVFVTRDGGGNWQKVDIGVPDQLDIAIDPADASKAIISGASNIKSCRDYLAECVDSTISGVKLRFVVFDEQVPRRIYGGTELGGVLVSTDAGTSWRRLGRNLPIIGINDMKWQGGRLYVANNTGMYEFRVDQFGQPAAPGSLSVSFNSQPAQSQPSAVQAHAGTPLGGASTKSGDATTVDYAVTARWSAVPNATSYRLFRGTTEVWRGRGTSGIDRTPPLNVEACYQVVAENDEGAGAWSTPACTRLAVEEIVYEFYAPTLNHYFRTAHAAEAATLRGNPALGWQATGNDFVAYPRAGYPAGAAEVCRFYGSLNPGPNSHFYTADPAECAFLRQLQQTTPVTSPRWNYEETAFAADLPQAGSCPARTPIPVYRAYNNRAAQIDSNHRYTTEQAQYATLIAQGWRGEGVVMCAVRKN